MSEFEGFDVVAAGAAPRWRRPSSARLLMAVGAAIASLLMPSISRAIPLDTIAGTTSAVGGVLTIQWTRIEQTGGLDLGGIDMVLASDGNDLGFDLVAAPGAFAVGSGGLADLKLEFVVTSTLAITQVRNELGATVSGDLSGASVFETIAEAPAQMVLAFVMESVAQNPTTEALAPGLMQLTIVKNAIVTAEDSAGPGGDFARIDTIQQRFAVVPEPSTALLVMLGLSGFCTFGRTRSSVRDGAQRKERG